MTRFAYFAGHEQFQPEELVVHAKRAEDAGFDMILVSEQRFAITMVAQRFDGSPCRQRMIERL